MLSVSTKMLFIYVEKLGQKDFCCPGAKKPYSIHCAINYSAILLFSELSIM